MKTIVNIDQVTTFVENFPKLGTTARVEEEWGRDNERLQGIAGDQFTLSDTPGDNLKQVKNLEYMAYYGSLSSSEDDKDWQVSWQKEQEKMLQKQRVIGIRH